MDTGWLIAKLAIAGLALSCMYPILKTMPYNYHSNIALSIYNLSMTYILVDGVQPLIKENPSQLAAAEHQLQQSAQLQLPKEMRQFYYRATSILTASRGPEDKTAQAVLTALRTDKGE